MSEVGYFYVFIPMRYRGAVEDLDPEFWGLLDRLMEHDGRDQVRDTSASGCGRGATLEFYVQADSARDALARVESHVSAAFDEGANIEHWVREAPRVIPEDQMDQYYAS